MAIFRHSSVWAWLPGLKWVQTIYSTSGPSPTLTPSLPLTFRAKNGLTTLSSVAFRTFTSAFCSAHSCYIADSVWWSFRFHSWFVIICILCTILHLQGKLRQLLGTPLWILLSGLIYFCNNLWNCSSAYPCGRGEFGNWPALLLCQGFYFSKKRNAQPSAAAIELTNTKQKLHHNCHRFPTHSFRSTNYWLWIFCSLSPCSWICWYGTLFWFYCTEHIVFLLPLHYGHYRYNSVIGLD